MNPEGAWQHVPSFRIKTLGVSHHQEEVGAVQTARRLGAGTVRRHAVDTSKSPTKRARSD